MKAKIKNTDKCPHCGATGIDYRNYKHHLYMYCVDPMLINDKEEQTRNEYLIGIREGKDKQFVWNKDKERVECKCGHVAVFMRQSFLCGTVTAYPCKHIHDL